MNKLLSGAALAGLLVLAGCSSDDSGGTGPSGTPVPTPTTGSLAGTDWNCTVIIGTVSVTALTTLAYSGNAIYLWTENTGGILGRFEAVSDTQLSVVELLGSPVTGTLAISPNGNTFSGTVTGSAASGSITCSR